MIKLKIEYKLNGVWTELRYWSRPVNTVYKLDETLDTAKIVLNRQNMIRLKPFTPLRITRTDDNGLINTEYLVTALKSNERQSIS